MLKYRLITAFMLMPLVLWVLFFASPVVFSLTLLLIDLLAAREWARLIGFSLNAQWLFSALHMLLLALLLLVLDQLRFTAPLTLGLGLLSWIIAFINLYAFAQKKDQVFDHPLFKITQPFFLLIPFCVAINTVRNLPEGDLYLLLLLGLVWAADTGAYFIGRLWGKHKLAEKISPKKTLEGLYGALATSVLIAFIAGFIRHDTLMTFLFLLLLCLSTTFFSVLGDLFESLLKRKADVKDSGRLLPGHGGLLDRIDGLIAATPLFALGVLVMARM